MQERLDVHKAGVTPKIHFERRASASFNLAGEKLDEAQVARAVGAVLGRRGVRASFFAAEPRIARGGARPRWELVLEPADVPPRDLAAALRDELDHELGRINEDYADERRSNLDRLALRVLSPGEFARDRARRIEAGAPEAQLKIVHLAATEGAYDHLDEALLVE